LARYGPWALVAGASEGTGAAFAEALAQRGLNVALVARRATPSKSVADRLATQHHVETLPIVADLDAGRAPPHASRLTILLMERATRSLSRSPTS
jgi:short-subunit dehydrogenase